MARHIRPRVLRLLVVVPASEGNDVAKAKQVKAKQVKAVAAVNGEGHGGLGVVVDVLVESNICHPQPLGEREGDRAPRQHLPCGTKGG